MPATMTLSGMTMRTHLPLRPDWTCGGCGRPWPCPAARADLILAHLGDPAGLAATMMAWMRQAVDDGLPEAELQPRFLAWTAAL
jgi:hypothetical protein